ncbi:centrosome-associated protein CEP250 [Fundulus heteroclitus]|uniref:centrosome-associated protein CEP250 n=1 Tax=Fundulus heteroclitus TaxID=8078 RepID=UPI00165A6B13|nr:centrosome-associated protein CEP250 [Fundulus heteroclitus]
MSDNKDGNKGVNRCIRTSTAARPSERRPTDCIKIREEVSDLRRKCEKEQTRLRLKWIQLKDVELCLSELRQKKRQALQQLERLSADTAQMQKEKKSLESALRHSRYQLQQLQRQRESCLKYGFCWDRSRGKRSALELEEMDRQLDRAKAELFAERRRSREKIESLQEQLEEVHEELHRATEAGSSLLNRCACRHKQMETGHLAEEVLGLEVSEPQHEVGGWRVRIETLGHTLAQREQQLTGLQEERESLRAERDNLKRELQLLKSQRCRERAEAQEEAGAVTQQELSIQRRQLEEEKDQALTSLQTRLIQEHSEELRPLGCVNKTDGGAAASLCRRLKAKDQELRRLQVSKGQRKQQTAPRLAQQLTAEPERFAVPQDEADKMQKRIKD